MKNTIIVICMSLVLGPGCFAKEAKRKPASAECVTAFKSCVSEDNPTKASGACNQAVDVCQKGFSQANAAQYDLLVKKCDDIEKNGGTLARPSANYCRALLTQFVLAE